MVVVIVMVVVHVGSQLVCSERAHEEESRGGSRVQVEEKL